MSFKPLAGQLIGVLVDCVGDPAARTAIVCRSWQRIVGSAVARRTVARDFDDGVLVVEVTDPSWVDVLDGMTEELVARMNAALGKRRIRRIEWCSVAAPPTP